MNTKHIKNNINILKTNKQNIKQNKEKEEKDEKIIFKTPFRTYSWEDLKILSSI